jgi:Neurotransmitter-gated ion-channel ligand binding domain
LNPKSACYLFPSGKVTCKRRFNVDAYCDMDYKRWPHDTQSCTVYFGTWIETRVRLVPTGRKSDEKKGYYYNYKRNNRRWLVKNITIQQGTQAVSDSSDYVVLNFELQRKDENHYTTFVAPAMSKIYVYNVSVCILRIPRAWSSTVSFMLKLLAATSSISKSFKCFSLDTRFYILSQTKRGTQPAFKVFL